MSQFSVSQGFGLQVPVTHPESYPYDIKPTDYAIIVDSSQATTINLPSNPSIGNRYLIKDGTGDSGANPITIEGNGNTIDSFSNYVIQLSYGFVGVLFDGTEWKIINQ